VKLSSFLDVMAHVDALRAEGTSTGIRKILGIAGAPGAGKSTLAALIAERLGRDSCIVVPMDGFHLANRILTTNATRDRKGAIDTFDVGGYLSLLGRLTKRDELVVYAPSYERGLEEPIAAAIAVPQSIDFILTEGNYLFSSAPHWSRIHGLLDARETRIERLVERHMLFGMDRDSAERWANGPDETNAQLVNSTRERADHVVTIDE
jgi:pantothenate kinase